MSCLSGLSVRAQVARPAEVGSNPAPLELKPGNQRLLAAVYPFQLTNDQQAQSRNAPEMAQVSDYSAILFRVLESSGWFTPVRPDSIGRLLNTGATNTRSDGPQPTKGTGSGEPTLILEAGLFSHDTQDIPDEVGSRYLAADYTGHYRMDRTTVFIRALSAQSGKILKTVYWTKTLLSQPLGNQTSRYVVVDRLHGNTSGSIKLSPDQYILVETLKDAVRGLIIEGVRDGLWPSANVSSQQTAAIFTAYESEKAALADAQQIDMQPIKTTSRLNPAVTPLRFSVGLHGGLVRYHGDYSDWATNGTYGLSLEGYVNPYVGVQLNLAAGTLSSRNAFSTPITTSELNLILKLLPYHQFTPLVHGGVGMVSRSKASPVDLVGKAYFQFQVGGGVQYSFNDTIGLRALLAYNLPNTDMLDGKQLGNRNDFYVRTTLGLLIHFGSAFADRE